MLALLQVLGEVTLGLEVAEHCFLSKNLYILLVRLAETPKNIFYKNMNGIFEESNELDTFLWEDS